MVAGTFTRIAELLRRFPFAVSGVFLFSLFMTFVYGPYDVLVKPFTQSLAQAEEVWLGFMLRGWAAKLTEPLHWLVYAGLSYGFYRERAWAWPLASLYTLQVAIGMVIWSWVYASQLPGMKAVGVGIALFFTWVAAGVWRARPAVATAAQA
jgi:hypothetical protein